MRKRAEVGGGGVSKGQAGSGSGHGSFCAGK